MAQTLSGLAEQAKSKLTDAFNQDPKADKAVMVGNILSDLSPTDVSSILQLASLNPELLDQPVIDAINSNVHIIIKNALTDQLAVLQADLDAKQAEIDAQQADLDSQKSDLNDLGQAINGI